jgi:hypothetical protein
MDKLDSRCLVRVLGHKMGETCMGLNTTSKGLYISFPTPTQTHVSDNRSNVTAVYTQPTCGVQRLLKFCLGRVLRARHRFGQRNLLLFKFGLLSLLIK